MRRRWKSRLGVSTVIANMLMILITLSLAAILVAWAGTSYGAFSSGTQVFFQERGQALQENFVIEQVYFNKTVPDQIYVFVRNVGFININIAAIYVNGTSLPPVSTGHGSTCTFSDSLSSASIGVGSVCEFSVNWPTSACPPNTCPWVTGNTFYIVVASTRGNQVGFTARGP